MEDIKVNEDIVSDVEKEETKDKPTTKQSNSKRTKSAQSTKECEVLYYNKKNNTAIISFDGFGYELKNISEDPGDKVLVKYTGNVHSPKFNIELAK